MAFNLVFDILLVHPNILLLYINSKHNIIDIKLLKDKILLIFRTFKMHCQNLDFENIKIQVVIKRL